jgi:hypothetical protein
MEVKKYQCEYCDNRYKTAKSRWNHVNKFHSNNVIQNKENVIQNVIQSNPKKWLCCHCKKDFKFRQGKWKHEQKCKKEKIIQNNDLNVLPINGTLNNSNISNINNSNLIINAGIINDNKQITINNFGNDNLDYITDKFKKNLLKHFLFEEEFTEPIPKLIQNINFNSNHKENNNVKITNMRSKTGQKYMDEKWIHASKEALLEELFAFGDKCIQKFLDEMDNIPLNIQDGFDEFQGRKELLKDFIKKEIELIAFVYCKNRDNNLDV